MGTDPALVIFSALYPPHAGGVEMYTQSLARALVRSGRRTIVVTMALGADSGWSEESGVEVLRLPCRPLLGGRYPAATNRTVKAGAGSKARQSAGLSSTRGSTFYRTTACALRRITMSYLCSSNTDRLI